MPKGIFIPVDEQQPIEIKDFAGLKPLQEAVGGLIEPLSIARPDATIFANEEGRLIGLDMNRRASLVLWVHNSRYRGHSAVLGDVVIIGQPDDEGATLDVPDELVELLFNTETYKYQVTTIEDPETWCGNQVTFTGWVEAYNAALVKASRWALVDEVRVLPS